MTKLLALSRYMVDHRAPKWLRLLVLLALATSWVSVTAAAATFSATLDRDTVTLGEETRVIVSPEAQQLRPGGKIFLQLKAEGMTLWPREP